MTTDTERKVLALQEFIKTEKEAIRPNEKREYEISIREFAELLGISEKKAAHLLTRKVREGTMTKRLYTSYEDKVKVAYMLYAPV